MTARTVATLTHQFEQDRCDNLGCCQADVHLSDGSILRVATQPYGQFGWRVDGWNKLSKQLACWVMTARAAAMARARVDEADVVCLTASTTISVGEVLHLLIAHRGLWFDSSRDHPELAEYITVTNITQVPADAIITVH